MKVTITYRDSESLSVEEVVRQAEHNYGKGIKVETMPDSTAAYDLIYFGLQQIMTHEQLSLIYERNGDYQGSLKKLRSTVLYKIQEIVDQVIVDNEARVT